MVFALVDEIRHGRSSAPPNLVLHLCLAVSGEYVLAERRLDDRVLDGGLARYGVRPICWTSYTEVSRWTESRRSFACHCVSFLLRLQRCRVPSVDSAERLEHQRQGLQRPRRRRLVDPNSALCDMHRRLEECCTKGAFSVSHSPFNQCRVD